MKSAFEILGYVSEAINTKDAFRRLLDKCREFAGADAGAVLKPLTPDRASIVFTTGEPLRKEFMFASVLTGVDLANKVLSYEASDFLFDGTQAACNLKIGMQQQVSAYVRLEWRRAEGLARERLKQLQEALTYVGAIIEHFKKFDTRISVHPAMVRPEDLELELDSPDLKTIFRKISGFAASRHKLETLVFAIRTNGPVELAVEEQFGKRIELPDRLRRVAGNGFIFEAFDTKLPSLSQANECVPRAVAIPLVYKDESLGVAIVTWAAGFSTDEIEDLRMLLGQATLYVKKALLLRRTREENPRTPLLLVGVPRDVLDLAEAYSDSDAPILIKGETGTGKESLARFVHLISRRAARPFLPFNCAELVETLAESQLFGHVKGAFTGAYHDSAGIFEQAHGGTLFLDEVHRLNAALQAKFLRAIETGEIRPVGSQEPRRIDCRIIVATNQDLSQLVAQGKFLHDLAMRLDVLEIALPPLRENRQSLLRIASVLLGDIAARNGKKIEGFTPRAKQALLRYDFPGNIRELRNFLEMAVVRTRGNVIDVDSFPKKLMAGPENARAAGGEFEADYKQFKNLSEKRYLEKLLEITQGNISEASKVSGLHRTHIYNLLRKHKVDPERFKAR